MDHLNQLWIILENFFYTADGKSEELLLPEKFIISGRKGTGKTILAHYAMDTLDKKKESLLCYF